jgi:hypothetical protein
MRSRRSILAEEMVGQHGQKHGIQENNQEQGDMSPSPVPRQFGLDRLQLPVLGKIITVAGFQRVLLPVNPVFTSPTFGKKFSQMVYAAAHTCT